MMKSSAPRTAATIEAASVPILASSRRPSGQLVEGGTGVAGNERPELGEGAHDGGVLGEQGDR
jgi:hypothetical protein